MRMLIVSGHTSGYNKCELTGVNEGDLNIELASKIYSHLAGKYNGLQVELYPTERDLYKDHKANAAAVNIKDYDYIFEIHFNGFSNPTAVGSSIYLHETYAGGTSVEQGVLDILEEYGFKLRGNKGFNRSSTLLNMNRAYQAGVDYALLETCFYTSPTDMERYTSHKEDIALNIALIIAARFGFSGADEPKTPVEESENEDKKLYRVQVGAFQNRENAQKMLDLVEGAGLNGYIKYD